jgi:hypothetical protein
MIQNRKRLLATPRRQRCHGLDCAPLARPGGYSAIAKDPQPDDGLRKFVSVRQRIVDLALDEPALSPRELAVRFAEPLFCLGGLGLSLS